MYILVNIVVVKTLPVLVGIFTTRNLLTVFLDGALPLALPGQPYTDSMVQ
jgi:hypothetical protein